MGGYAVNFTVYVLAMTGLICFAVFICKKIMAGGFANKCTRYIEIEDTLSINPRKSLHVVRAGNEKFLIASDFDRTSLISKLNETSRSAITGDVIDELYSQQKVPFNPAADVYEDTRRKSSVRQPQNIQNTRTKPYVHLEPIRHKEDRGIGIANLRKSLDDRAGETPVSASPQRTQRNYAPQRTVRRQEQNFESYLTPQISQRPARTAAMKNLAMKINEL